ncbi:LysM peptidoglycan-binding domain-containing protein [Reinekea sp.]|uniref:lytic transglycosylase n=1 Tax=Reinekea sp. TaxID=1970455 RepID=UPI002A837834|nr:LysM peptidoglycan-binding domain-containing protein [Reinekea sp.]
MTACNLLPVQPVNPEPQSAPIEAAIPPPVAVPVPVPVSLVSDPNQEALAQTLRGYQSAQLLASSTESYGLWHLPLDLTRPDPYAHYPDDLYQVLRRNLSFNLDIDDKRVATQLRWYASHQSYINRVSDRASRYLFHIVAELQARDMPLDLALLPIVESAFDPFAYSHGRASGMWQFIPETGRMFGLKQDWWYDGRRDVVESTRAALDYLDHLQKMFDGDWLLALASYNSGPGTVRKAQRKNRAAGKETDFWHLDLPRETEAYVPKIIALAKLFKTPDAYGIVLPEVSTEPYFKIVQTGGQIDLAQAAALADMELSDLYLLNPGYNRWATDPDGPHQLLVYTDREQLFTNNIAQLASNERLTWGRYNIVSGDSLLSIAYKFDVTVDIIKDVNGLKGNLIRAGDKLMIPVASEKDTFYALSADSRLKVKQNAPASSNLTRIDHVIKTGDTFWDLSRQYKVSLRSLAKWNNMAPRDTLRPGQSLVIWVKPGASDSASTGATLSTSTSSSAENRQVVRKVGYVVRNGDSLYRIADKFNLRISDIQKWNVVSKYLQPGDRLTLYVDVTNIN